MQPPLPSPRPILSCLPPYAAPQLQPGRGAVPKLPSAMGNGEPSLNCLLPPLNITDEEALEVVVNETDKLARICELYRYKKTIKKLPKLKKKTKSSRKSSKCASLWEFVDRGLGGAEYVILRGGFSLEEGNSFSVAQISLLLFVKFAEFVFDKTVNLNLCSQNPHRLNSCSSNP